MSSNITYKEILEDEIYNKAYIAARKQFDKKYNKLHEASKRFFYWYTSIHGEPDKEFEKDNNEIFALKKLITAKNKNLKP